MSICFKCNSEINNAWKFCPECGIPINSIIGSEKTPFGKAFYEAVNYFPVGVFILDEQMNFIYCNKAFVTIAGYEEDMLNAMSLVSIIHPDDIDTITNENLSNKTGVTVFETRLTKPNGSLVWVNMNITFIKGQFGLVNRLMGMCFDISRQKAAEEEVARQNTIMDLLHETSLAIINRLDVKGLLLAILQKAANLAGTSHGYIYFLNRETGTMEMEIGIGRYVEHKVENLKPYKGSGGRVWKTGEPLFLDDYSQWPDRLPDLPFYPKALIGLPLKSGDEVIGIITVCSMESGRVFSQTEVLRLGQFAELASIALNNALLFTELKQEISERKKAEEALFESTEKLRAIVNSAKDFIYLKDKNLVYQEINPAMYERLGITREEIIGKTDENLFGEEVARYTRENEEKALMGETVEAELVLNIKNIPHVFANLVTPLRDMDSNVLGISGIMRDITERKKAEKELLHAKEIVAHSERLASLGTMVAGISHEINQPLNSIKMSSSGLIYCYKNRFSINMNEIMEGIEEISQQADRIDRVIKHIRSLIKVKEGEEFTVCDLNRIIEHALELIGSQISNHGIFLNQKLSAVSPMVLGTETGLEMVIINLITNAIQALDEVNKKNKEISIITSVKDSVILEVRDNGSGIEPEISDKIFDVFFTTKANRSNMGFGLSIAHSIVASCKGEIYVNSAKGQGTSFFVEFPKANG